MANKLHLFTLVALILIPSNIVLAHESGSEVVIHMNENGFAPSKVNIKQGQAVEFENTGNTSHWPASNVHPTHESYSEFDPKKPVKPGESWGFIFDNAGVWQFHDHLFPEFVGTVTVTKDFEAENTKEVKPKTLQNNQSIMAKLKAWLTRALLWIQKPFAQKTKSTETDVVFSAPETYDLSAVEQEYPSTCDEGDFGCFDTLLREVTKAHGPNAAIELFALWQDTGVVSPAVDDHQLSHRIGRQTASSYGVNSEAFLLCPMSAVNGGCQHGFFEHVLGQTETSSEAAQLICESLGTEYSSKFKFYCYHGVGHGVIMAQAYDLQKSLDVCNQLPSFVAQDGCWQGVFMENVNGAMIGEARDGVFSEEDPLAPCNKLDTKYHHECFINHAGWLMMVTNNSVGDGARLCLDAPAESINSCLQSIGLMVTNPSWQINLTVNSDKSFEQTAWSLCAEFPDQYQDQCVIGGVDNLLNFDEYDTKRAETFCKLAQGHTDLCYRRIGLNLSTQAIDSSEIASKCAEFENPYNEYCLEGANLND